MDIAQAVKVGPYGLAAVTLYTQCRMLNLEDIFISTVEDNIKNCPCRVDAMVSGKHLFQAVKTWSVIAVVKSCEGGNISDPRW